MRQNSQEPKIFIAISGNIGVGKTTLTTVLAERFGWIGCFEKEVKNPYLADFYQDMRQWAFHSQLFFLKERIKDHLQIQAHPAVCIQDRTIYEDAEIFARNLYDRQLMSERDYATYSDLYHAVSGALQPPDVFVYLRASIWTLISRIRKRGRDYEQKIDKEYLAQLNFAYDRWANDIAQRYRLMVIDTDRYDIRGDNAWFESILEEIYLAAIKSRQSHD